MISQIQCLKKNNVANVGSPKMLPLHTQVQLVYIGNEASLINNTVRLEINYALRSVKINLQLRIN